MAYFSVVADTEEELKRKHQIAGATVKALDGAGVDLLRHELIKI